MSSSTKWRDLYLTAIKSCPMNSYIIKLMATEINTQAMRPTAHCPKPWSVKFSCLLIGRQEVAKQEQT